MDCPPPRLQMAMLKINNQKLPLYEGVNTIGRGKGAVANIKHVNVSQNHAVIVIMDEQQHFISDLNSSNGTLLGNCKMIPFKLYQLKHNSEITLGNLPGLYISQGPFLEYTRPAPLGLATQSFFECNTQLLESTIDQNTTEDIHEAPTQEISWTTTKKLYNFNNSAKQIINKSQPANLMENNVTSSTKSSSNPIPINLILAAELNSIENDFSDEHHPVFENIHIERIHNIENDVNDAEVHKEQSSSIYDEATEVFDIKKTSHLASYDAKVDNDDDDDEMTDCEEDFGAKIELDDSSNCDINNRPKIGLKNILTKSPIINASDMDNTSNDSVEFLKSDDVKSGKSAGKSHYEGDSISEATDDDEDNDADVVATTKRMRKSRMVLSTQDLCEPYGDKNSPEENKMEEDDNNVNNDSTDGSVMEEMEEKKKKPFDDSIPATQNQTVNDLDDSDFVAATQDVNAYNRGGGGSQNNKYRNVGSSEDSCFKLGLTELMDESESVLTFKSNLKDDVIENSIIIQNNSFQEENDENIYDAPTQKISIGKIKDKSSEQVLCVNTDDTFLAPTQKVNFIQPGSLASLKTLEEETDLYDEATQKMFSDPKMDKEKIAPLGLNAARESHNNMQVTNDECEKTLREDDDLYDVATQKIFSDPKKDNKIAHTDSHAYTDDTFLAPTQKVNFTQPGSSSTSLKILREDDDLYDAATQKIFSDPKVDRDIARMGFNAAPESHMQLTNDESQKTLQEDNDLYDAATQKIFSDPKKYNKIAHTDSCSAPGSHIQLTNDESQKTLQEETDLYEQATQKIFSDPKKDKKIAPIDLNAAQESRTQRQIDLYDAPTQKMFSNSKIDKKIASMDSNAAPESHVQLTNDESQKTLQEETDLYAAATQKIFSDPKKDKKIAPKDLNAAQESRKQKETDLYDAPTQKIFSDPKKDKKIAPKDLNAVQESSMQEETDLYDAATQKIFSDPKIDEEFAPMDSDAARESHNMQESKIYVRQNTSGSSTSEPDTVVSPIINKYLNNNNNISGGSKENEATTSVIKKESSSLIKNVSQNNNSDDFKTPREVNENTNLLNDIDDMDCSSSAATSGDGAVNKSSIRRNVKMDDASIESESKKNKKSSKEASDVRKTIARTRRTVNVLSKSKLEKVSTNMLKSKEDRSTVDDDFDNQFNDVSSRSSKLSLSNKGNNNKNKFSFKKKTCDLEASLSDLTEDVARKRNNNKNTNSGSSTEQENETWARIPSLPTSSISRDSGQNAENIKQQNIKLGTNVEVSIIDKPLDDDVKNVNDVGKKQTNKIKPDENTSATDTGCDVNNKSIAIYEQKSIKTKKTRNKLPELHVTIPRTRRSMSISKCEEFPPHSKSLCAEIEESKHHLNKVPKEKGNSAAAADDTQISMVVVGGKRNRLPSKKLVEVGVDFKPPPRVDTTRRRNRQTILLCHAEAEPVPIGVTQTSVRQQRKPRPHSISVNNFASSSSKSTRISSSSGTDDDDDDVESKQKIKIEKTRVSKQVKQVAATKRKASSAVRGNNTNVALASTSSSAVLEKHQLESSSPKKQKMQSAGEATSADTTLQRGLRKQRPKVVFTMMESPQLESLIKQMGGSIVDSVEACTVLVTERIKRSQKLLSAIGLGKPICSPKWITDSKKNQDFLDPWDYILTDPEAEKKWTFSLKESLTRSRSHKLLESYSLYIHITNGADVLKGAIESCGGKWLPKIPTTPLENAYVISSPENQSKYRKIQKKHSYIKVIEAEAIFDGVLRQELRFSRHILE